MTNFFGLVWLLASIGVLSFFLHVIWNILETLRGINRTLDNISKNLRTERVNTKS